ncbi:AAA family ATPase [Paenibacillus periandrae]|uniref:AAA family ATPase n=1 Tax=Paenibacillus periandrae TaxID=1761741 RepID=UPI001F099420|nr:AAA family ATPase [Paenibacillus periandrae]
MIIIITGPSGVGKTTVCSLLASQLKSSVHINYDEVYNFIGADEITEEYLALTDENIADMVKNYRRYGFKYIIIDGVYETRTQYEAAYKQLLIHDQNIVSFMLYCEISENQKRNNSRSVMDLMTAQRINELNEVFRLMGPGGFDYTLDTTNLSLETTLVNMLDLMSYNLLGEYE